MLSVSMSKISLITYPAAIKKIHIIVKHRNSAGDSKVSMLNFDKIGVKTANQKRLNVMKVINKLSGLMILKNDNCLNLKRN